MKNKFKIGDIVYWLSSDYNIIHSNTITDIYKDGNMFEYRFIEYVPSRDLCGNIMSDGYGPGQGIITHAEYFTLPENILIGSYEEARKQQIEQSPLKDIDLTKVQEEFWKSFNPSNLSLY